LRIAHLARLCTYYPFGHPPPFLPRERRIAAYDRVAARTSEGVAP
jgi:hypothetical protein